MRAYSQDHTHPVNKATHLFGIPLIVASLPVLPFNPPAGLGMFTAGWALQFIGHAFEGKKPSFTRDLRYLLIGPVWISVEWIELLTGVRIYEPPAEAASTEVATAEAMPAAVGQA
jgi:uncharacterized membrane protein YGL010W